jgi:hypothetical protein
MDADVAKYRVIAGSTIQVKLLFFPLVHKPRTAGEHDRADDFLESNTVVSYKAYAWSNMMVRTRRRRAGMAAARHGASGEPNHTGAPYLAGGDSIRMLVAERLY